MNLLMVWSDQVSEFNCSWHRIINPGLALRRAGYQVEFIHNNDWEQNTPDAIRKTEVADLVVFQRNVFGNALGRIIDWVSQGKRIVIDVDDAYHHMDELTGSRTWGLWRLGRYNQDGKEYQYDPVPLVQLETGVRIAGMLSTPSHILEEDWRKLAHPFFIPNLLDLRVYRRRETFRKDPGKVYIGWAGSRGHLRGWRESGILQALTHIAERHKEVIFALAGENAMVKWLKVAPSRIVEVPWRCYAQYPDFLSVLDVAVIPLAGEYDRRRSCLKSLEMTAMGIPWVGSDVEPNQAIGSGIRVQNTSEGWIGALEGILADLPVLRAQAQEDRTLVEEWAVDNNIEFLMNAYEGMANG